MLNARELGMTAKSIDLHLFIEFIHTPRCAYELSMNPIAPRPITSNSLFGNAASVLVGDFRTHDLPYDGGGRQARA